MNYYLAQLIKKPIHVTARAPNPILGVPPELPAILSLTWILSTITYFLVVVFLSLCLSFFFFFPLGDTGWLSDTINQQVYVNEPASSPLGQTFWGSDRVRLNFDDKGC